jgi:predicted aldo/keto reductase-like oxidoreductase
MRVHAKFDINTNIDSVQMACLEMMKSALHQQCYKLKRKYFDHFPLHMVSETSSVKSTSDEQRNQLVEVWKNPIKMVCCLYLPKFFPCTW